MTKEIKVIDYVMGTGKTKYIFEYMQANPHKKYIYVTPLLSEAEKRAVEQCGSISMVSPVVDERGNTKSQHMLELLKEGLNISTTHTMFKNLRKQHLKQIEYWGYTLIIDETVDFIESYNDYNQADIKDLSERGDLLVHEDMNGRVSMEWDISEGNTYEDLKGMCDAGLVYSTKKPHTMLNVQVPPVIIDAAAEVFVLTYLYEHSLMRSFMDLHGFTHKKLIIPHLEDKTKEVKERIRTNLKIVEVKAADNYLKNTYKAALSHSWWNTMIKKNTATDLFKFCSNWLNNNLEHKDSFFFTCPKVLVSSENKQRRTKAVLEKAKLRYFSNPLGESVTEEILDTQGKKHKVKKTVNIKWLFSGTKATNDFCDRKMCFYLINVYPNLAVQHYLGDYGLKIDEDMYALSEMLQFIWRGNIRTEGGEITVYIASPRMKKLLQDWIGIH